MICVIEDETPMVKLLVWGIREEGHQVMAVPMPAQWRRTPDTRHVIFNFDFPPEECGKIVHAVRTRLADASILHLATHEIARCGADAQLPPPYRVADVLSWVRS
jgi:hypothetical protein